MGKDGRSSESLDLRILTFCLYNNVHYTLGKETSYINEGLLSKQKKSVYSKRITYGGQSSKITE